MERGAVMRTARAGDASVVGPSESYAASCQSAVDIEGGRPEAAGRLTQRGMASISPVARLRISTICRRTSGFWTAPVARL